MIQAVTQFSVFLINKPGILAQVTETLAEKKINLVALTLMDSVEHGVFRLVATDTDKARAVLSKLGLSTTETPVLAAEMSNRPGALADLCAKLNSEHISIKYAYVTSGAFGGHTTGIFNVDNMEKALRVLKAASPKTKEKENRAVRTSRAVRSR